MHPQVLGQVRNSIPVLCGALIYREAIGLQSLCGYALRSLHVRARAGRPAGQGWPGRPGKPGLKVRRWGGEPAPRRAVSESGPRGGAARRRARVGPSPGVNWGPMRR